MNEFTNNLKLQGQNLVIVETTMPTDDTNIEVKDNFCELSVMINTFENRKDKFLWVMLLEGLAKRNRVK